MNLKKFTKNKNFYIYLFTLIFVIIPILIFSIVIYSRLVTRFVYKANSNSISNLAVNDSNNIRSSILTKFANLDSITKRLSKQKIDSKEDLQYFLEIERDSAKYSELFLIQENGNVEDYSNYPFDVIETIESNFYMYDSFIARVISNAKPYNLQDYVVFCTKTDPVEINGTTYIGICSMENLTEIKGPLLSLTNDYQLSKFICTSNGNYLLSSEAKNINNYFTKLKKSQITNLSSLQVIKKIQCMENFSFTYSENGKKIYTYIQQIPDINLFLVLETDTRAFLSEGNLLINFSITFSACLVIVLIAFLFVTLIIIGRVNLIKSESNAKAEFLSTMSHEIRTPLNGIIGLIHLMENNMTDQERLNYYFKKTKKASNYLLQLINNILDISKFENGKIKLANNPFFIDEMIESVASIHRDNMIAKGINFEVTQNIFCSSVFGDEIRIQQIIMNLIGNAYKFTDENGKITLAITQENTFETDEISTIFRVTDTGCGISKDFQKHIFEAFSQERNKSKDSQKGTGLGLAISYMLAKQMNGKLEVESEPGKGSTFIFTLPSKIASPKQVNEYIMESSAVNTEKEHNILIAEDNDLNAEILDEVFTDENIKHRIVTDGKQVIEVFEESAIEEYDVILMDIQMPYYDGYEATQIIRKMKRSDANTVKIIACSANTFEEDKVQAKKAGMNGFIVKPINVNTLLQLLGN